MVARKQFDSSVDIHEFARMNERLGPGLRMQIFLAKKSGQILAAVVCSQIGSTAIYLLGATNEAARELKAAYALHWKSMIFFKERGATFYDLGGVDPVANPGGYHFKTGFGGTEIESLQSQFSAGNVASRIAQSLRNLLANSQ
jgi:lipid II:glycine glycyltransferase (peptidoglycan interpeptide bridge formation enzyme)